MRSRSYLLLLVTVALALGAGVVVHRDRPPLPGGAVSLIGDVPPLVHCDPLGEPPFSDPDGAVG